MTAWLTLILGGAKSGKSAFAERLAAHEDRVLFVATAEARDADMAQRIKAHQANRPATWQTLEEPLELSRALNTALPGHTTAIVDCLTLWVSNLLMADGKMTDRSLAEKTSALLQVVKSHQARWIFVSNEVGLGVVPSTELGGHFRDLLGRVNQQFAVEADQVYLMVAGLPIDVKALAMDTSGSRTYLFKEQSSA